MTAIGDFDHCMILVPELEAADQALIRLGFRPTPRGYHSAHMGTANATVVFRDRTYLETLGIVVETPANLGQRARLASGPGPYGLAYKTADAEAVARDFAARQLGPGEAQAFSRPVEVTGGPKDAAFTTARTHHDTTPGAWLFCVQHLTPELVWQEAFLDHPNGVQGLCEIVGVASDLDRIARGWAVFEGRLQRGAEAVTVGSGTARLSFLQPRRFAERFGEEAATVLPPPAIALFVLRTADLEGAAGLLARNGINPARTAEGAVLTPRIPELGAAFAFVSTEF